MRARATSFKAEQPENIITIDATASSLAKETRIFSIAGSNRTCSNRES